MDRRCDYFCGAGNASCASGAGAVCALNALSDLETTCTKVKPQAPSWQIQCIHPATSSREKIEIRSNISDSALSTVCLQQVAAMGYTAHPMKWSDTSSSEDRSTRRRAQVHTGFDPNNQVSPTLPYQKERKQQSGGRSVTATRDAERKGAGKGRSLKIHEHTKSRARTHTHARTHAHTRARTHT